MKACFIFSYLFVVGAIFASSDHLTARETTPLFQSYLAACKLQNTENQPVHLRNASQEKEPSFTEMTILDLDIPSTMQIEAVAERILYGDADVVHLANISTQRVSHLYEMLQSTYSHFIHVPSKGQGLFIASKYPFSTATITLVERENVADKELLEFTIHGANTYHASVCSNDFSMQVINSDDTEDNTITPILLVDMPGVLTIMKQRFSPFRVARKIGLLAADTFQIVPVKRKGGENDNDKGGYKGEIEIGRSWGGRDGGHWEGTAKFEAHDNRGNYVEAEVRQNDEGEGSVHARAGHEEE